MHAKGIFKKNAFTLRSKLTAGSILKAKGPAKTGMVISIKINPKPRRLIRAAKGTMNMFAMTVTGENILK